MQTRDVNEECLQFLIKNYDLKQPRSWTIVVQAVSKINETTLQNTSESDSQSDAKLSVSEAWQPPWNHVATRNHNYTPIWSLKFTQRDPFGPQWRPWGAARDPSGGSRPPKTVTKSLEDTFGRHFGNWWRPHWANPIIYYVFDGSLAEKHIIYYVLTSSKQLISMKLYENIIIYYVLRPPEKSAGLKPRATWHTPSPRPPPFR